MDERPINYSQRAFDDRGQQITGIIKPAHLIATLSENRGAGALLILAGLCLLPFLRLAFCAHPYLDDFVLPASVREHGVWAHTVDLYLRFSGRFSNSLITALHPLAWGDLRSIKPFVFGLILAFAGSVMFAGHALLSGARIPLLTRLAAGSLVLSLFLLLLCSPTEAFYWLISALFYTVGCACCFLLLGMIASLQHELAPASRRIRWALAAILTFLAPGFSEMICCIVLALIVVLAPKIWRRQLAKSYLALLALAVVASAITVLAPGNFARQTTYVPMPLLSSLLRAVVAFAYTLVTWLGSGFLIVLTLLVLPALQNLFRLQRLPLMRLTQRVWLWPIWVLLGLLLCFVFCFVAIGAPPPTRARNLLFAFFIVGWFMSVVGYLNWRLRTGKKPLLGMPTYGRATLVLLLIITRAMKNVSYFRV